VFEEKSGSPKKEQASMKRKTTLAGIRSNQDFRSRPGARPLRGIAATGLVLWALGGGTAPAAAFENRPLQPAGTHNAMDTSVSAATGNRAVSQAGAPLNTQSRNTLQPSMAENGAMPECPQSGSAEGFAGQFSALLDLLQIN
jgi:hypothetical protein